MEDKLEKLNFLGSYLAASRTEEQILEMAMLISRDILGYDHAMIRLAEGERLISRQWFGFPREAADLVIRVGEGITGEVAASGATALVPDTVADPRYLAGMEGCLSELCVPITYNGQVIGTINVESDERGFFTETDQRMLETLASQTAAALEAARLRDELGRAEKLSVVGQMASSILHDIRNDIHQLHISADLLAKPSGGERAAFIAEMVRRAGDNIYHLIEDIFEFVKTGQAHLERRETILSLILDAVAEQTRSFAPEGVEVRLHTDPEIRLVRDPRRFKRVLLNLTRNACEAMEETGGLVDIAARPLGGGGAVIEVVDTGCGIPADRIGKIWEPLYTFGKKQGTGLGMAIVKKIVEEHGFAIAVSSIPGKGTTFTITAPPAG